MTKIDEAVTILKDVNFSKNITNKNMAARFIVAATETKPTSLWKNATNNGIQIHEALLFLNKYYETNFKENTRESLRKQGPKEMQTVGLAKNNVSMGIATNSKNYRWFLEDDFYNLVKLFGTKKYDSALRKFLDSHTSRLTLLQAQRNKAMIPVNYNGFKFKLTPGKHNILHKEVLEQFAPRFAGGSELLYVGDTSQKDLKFEKEKLKKLGFPMNMHDLLPDIILYDSKKEWLFLIEAVSSVGPMSIDRVNKINNNYTGKAGLIFVTAFQNWKVYKKFIGQIAWETEIWIAEFPDHMIHMNGDRFMGPRR